MPKTILYRHQSHSEWGHGVIVEEGAAKVYLTFEDGSRRSFMNLPKYREQLVAVELPASEAESVIAKITKFTAKAAPKKSGKKKPAKKAAKAAPVEEEAPAEEPDAEASDDDE